MKRGSQRVAFVTGFPSLLARRLIRRILEEEPRGPVRVLCPETRADEMAAFARDATPAPDRPLEVLEGDVARLDLGLSGAEWTALAREVTDVHHVAGVGVPGRDRPGAEAIVAGAREVVDLCREAPNLRRLHFWSSAMVSGDRRGVVKESELDLGQSFHDERARATFRAEKLLHRRGAGLPFTIYRPSHVVGDSRTGEIDSFEGPYQVVLNILRAPLDVALPLPSRADAPLHLVPIDYVVDAACAIGRRAEAVGATVHLVDDRPLPAREVFGLMARAAHRRVPRGLLPAPLTRALLRAPGVHRLGGSALAFVETMVTDVTYDTTLVRRLLADTGLACPRLETYIGELVAFVRAKLRQERAREKPDEAPDPLL